VVVRVFIFLARDSVFMIRRIVSFLWGDLQEEELKKFGLLALGFFFLIGSWWPLKTLKDSIFINMIGPIHLPEAKLASLLVFFPLVMFYSKLVDHVSKEKLIYFFISIYTALGLIFVYFLAHPTIGLANTLVSPFRILGWAFYLFCESYISLILALYWSFVNDVTTPESAKKGYGVLIFGTQLGGLLFTLLGNYLSYDPSKYATSAPLIALISILMFFGVGVVVFLLQHVVKHEHLESYADQIKAVDTSDTQTESVHFLDGLKLLLTHPYVMGIFAIIFFQEMVSTMMGFQLSMLAKTTYQEPGMVNKFLFDFALCVQFVACLFSLIGTSFFQRKLGIRSSLIAYPLLLGLFVVSYLIQPTLQTIFYVMLISKALGYALNQPAKEVLYIPTSRSIKYKSKAWIDMFGMRFAKASGSVLNRFIGPMIMLTGTVTISVVAIWIFIASILGNIFKNAVANKKLIE
jgi:AAA family ATP:ADP antiporter